MNNMLIRSQNVYSMPYLSLTHFLALRRFWAMSFMVTALFTSAISVVYVKAMNRILYSDLQFLQKDRDALSVEWSQLLLEQSTWATQSRIENIAESNLNMVIPQQNTVVMVKE